MFNKFNDFIDSKNKSGNQFNTLFNNIVSNYNYIYFIQDTLDQELENIANSKVIMINHYIDNILTNEELHFIIAFHETVLFVKQSLLSKLKNFFQQLKICFYCKNTKKFFDDNIKINNYEELEKTEYFDTDVKSISNNFFINSGQFNDNNFLNQIKSCISGYIIQKCYFDLNNYDRVKDFNPKEEIKPKPISVSKLIELRTIGTGSIFKADLYYHIYDEKLYIIKKPIGNDTEIGKLLERENSNLQKIRHPFIPKYYGTVDIDGNDCPVIEYINGRTLSKEIESSQSSKEIESSHLSELEKLKIITHLIAVVKYLHENGFICRDLKSDNFIIDTKKYLVVIDFDRMIEEKVVEDENFVQSMVFDNEKLTNEYDIYSIGKIIAELIPDIETNDNYEMIYSIYEECIDKNPSNRPSISFLFCLYLVFFESNGISIDFPFDIDHNDQYNLGLIYYGDQYISQDINKFIYYFTLAANQNHPNAQFYIGFIYYEGFYITRDINKSLYYLTLSANQNNAEAQFILGMIYYNDQEISQDINKAIYYLTLAANQNLPQAQYVLGIIYAEGQYISRDINKAINYLTLSSNQNNPKAQYSLGLIYYNSQIISSDISKAIYYFTLAANQENSKSQYILGLIYYKGLYTLRDINKSIYFFTLAANNNIPEAQYYLGLIYYEDQEVLQDINKAIYYLTLAANQNFSIAQSILGLIYYDNQYIPRDMNKSIHYFTLAANNNYLYAEYNLGFIYYNGQYVTRDINKSIYYFTLAANNNIPDAQCILGLIYYEDQEIPQDLNKAIYYFTLAANQNIPEAQHYLGVIYYEDQKNPRDINKAIYYFTLAAENNNYLYSQINLGLIYYKDQEISRDINKAIYYFTLAANQNNTEAHYILGYIYFLGLYISRDINKAIYYLTLASNENFPEAQYFIGLIYYFGIDTKQDIKKGINWIIKSSKNDCINAHYAIGFLYLDGKHMKRNIDESIKYFKMATLYDDQYTKNNLGIIYKNFIEKKYDYAVYFEEAIRQKNDPVSMYNLAHAYIYEYQDEKLINKSIELLINSSKQGFEPSTELLCILISQKSFKKQANEIKFIKIENIEQELSEFTKEIGELKHSIINKIQEQLLFYKSISEYYYKKYEQIEFVYDLFLKPVCIKDLHNEEKKQTLEENNITENFYEGFGYDIYRM